MVVRNAGIEWGSPENCYWQHRVTRKEAARIVLHGQSEFEASHVVLEGDQTFEVKGLPLNFGNGQIACGLQHLTSTYATWEYRHTCLPQSLFSQHRAMLFRCKDLCTTLFVLRALYLEVLAAWYPASGEH